MVMPHSTRVWTREEVWALPDDGKRYELIAGELLVSPSPGGMHQRAVARLYDLVPSYVRSHGLGETLFSPADLQLQSGDISQPDLFVIPPGWDGRNWEACGVPLLIAETLHHPPRVMTGSPSGHAISGPAWASIGSWTSMPGSSSAGHRVTRGRRCWRKRSRGSLPALATR